MRSREYSTETMSRAKSLEIRTAWNECPHGDWLLLEAGDWDVDRRLLVTAACRCARSVLKFARPGEDHPRLAIEATERWIVEPGPDKEASALEAARLAHAAGEAVAESALASESTAWKSEKTWEKVMACGMAADSAWAAAQTVTEPTPAALKIAKEAYNVCKISREMGREQRTQRKKTPIEYVVESSWTENRICESTTAVWAAVAAAIAESAWESGTVSWWMWKSAKSVWAATKVANIVRSVIPFDRLMEP